MAWRIEVDRSAQRDLKGLRHQPARRLLRFLHERVAPLDDPQSIGQALKGSQFGDFWKYRIGDFRVVASMADERVTIVIIRIGHRFRLSPTVTAGGREPYPPA